MSYTLKAPQQHAQTIKRSRFLAHAAPVGSEADALAFFDSVADPGATHNCWAWRLGGRSRYNDDGEPSGTAGRPLLALLEARDVDAVMLVVTRWYGGIKLGVGGLARAYAGTAAGCLQPAVLARQIARSSYLLRVEFSLAGVVHQLLDQHAAEKLAEDFNADGVAIRFRVADNRARGLHQALQDACSGRASIRRINA
jgi:uncharacterized YigZ family protein